MAQQPRIDVTGTGTDERFTVYVIPDESFRGPFMRDTGPMTEAEFRAALAAGGASEAVIEETINGARADSRENKP